MKYSLNEMVEDGEGRKWWRFVKYVDAEFDRKKPGQQVWYEPETKQEKLDAYVGPDLPKVATAGRKLIGSADKFGCSDERWEATWETGGPHPKKLDAEIKQTLTSLKEDQVAEPAEKMSQWATIDLDEMVKTSPLVRTVWYRVFSLAIALERFKELQVAKKIGKPHWWTGKTAKEQALGLTDDEKALVYYRKELVTRTIL